MALFNLDMLKIIISKITKLSIKNLSPKVLNINRRSLRGCQTPKTT